MKHPKRILRLVLATAVLGSAGHFWLARPSYACGQDMTQRVAKYEPVHEYDPQRDAASDIERAVAEARRAKKNVLLEVGGKWCVWCRIMDAYFAANPDVLKLREDNFVTVKVNFSPEN